MTTDRRIWIGVVAMTVAMILLLPGVRAAHAETLPERVSFPSADGRTTLIGYVFRPKRSHGVRVPAVVMMHGRGGV